MYAITRAISSAMQNCELTHLQRQPLDLNIAREQHAAYNDALRALNVTVIELDEQAELADSVFVEDTALVFDELAVITRPGADSRQAETASIAEALAPYRKRLFIEAPGLLDGGDVLLIDRHVYVGLSSRSNEHAVKQLSDHLTAYDYRVTGLNLGKCLHLKTAVTAIDNETVLLNPDWIDRSLFSDYKVVEVHSDEAFAANIVRIGNALLYASTFPKTQKMIEKMGYPVTCVNMSELAKAEGAVTCCSLIFNQRTCG